MYIYIYICIITYSLNQITLYVIVTDLYVIAIIPTYVIDIIIVADCRGRARCGPCQLRPGPPRIYIYIYIYIYIHVSLSLSIHLSL